jgi:dTDP-4-amino-4,6-dideoxygalactose transaminase
MIMIPLVDLKAQYESIQIEIDTAIKDVLSEANFIGGSRVQSFEKNFALAIGVHHCIGVANGTDSLVLILKALGIQKGENVFVPANSFIATSEAVTLAGGTPIFVDCDENYLIDIKQLDKQIKLFPTTRFLIVVHLYGSPINFDNLKAVTDKNNILVIEDAAQAHLAEFKEKKIGSLGIAGSFSFYPGKNLGAYGDAGAVVTNDQKIALKIRMLANHGRVEKYNHEIEGTNSRLDSLQATILDVKLKYLKEWTEKRIILAKRYNQYLLDLDIVIPIIPMNSKHVFHLYVIRIKNRENIQKKLFELGISTGVHYPIALPFLKAYQKLHFTENEYPKAYQYQKEILSLPIYPELSFDKQDFIIKSLKETLRDV